MQKTKTKAKTFIEKIPLPTSQAKDSAMEEHRRGEELSPESSRFTGTTTRKHVPSKLPGHSPLPITATTNKCCANPNLASQPYAKKHPKSFSTFYSNPEQLDIHQSIRYVTNATSTKPIQKIKSCSRRI